jgi:abequosyltransferase
MTPLLSICIPTFNRADMLLQLLNSIASESSADELEIAISDNASTDHTSAVVEEFSSRWPGLVYVRQPSNVGPDLNYMSCVSISRTPYCWLMGSDDCIAPGAVGKVLHLIREQDRDLFLGTRINCTFDMKPVAKESWLDVDRDHWFDFADDREFVAYHRHGRSLGAVFSYLSSIVVKRARWDEFALPRRYVGSAYSHAYVLLQVARIAGIHYTPEPLVLNRMGNDHFAQDGEARRILIDLNGYLLLASDLYPSGSPRQQALLSLLRRAHAPLRTIVALRSRLSGAEWPAAARTLRQCGYPALGVALAAPLRVPLAWLLQLKHERVRRRLAARQR